MALNSKFKKFSHTGASHARVYAFLIICHSRARRESRREINSTEQVRAQETGVQSEQLQFSTESLIKYGQKNS
jgi:hypothetical protein